LIIVYTWHDLPAGSGFLIATKMKYNHQLHCTAGEGARVPLISDISNRTAL
jgi:hypothetical protein